MVDTARTTTAIREGMWLSRQHPFYFLGGAEQNALCFTAVTDKAFLPANTINWVCRDVFSGINALPFFDEKQKPIRGQV
jgi:hypothetical protein